MGKITLITGGARSGKSTFALNLAIKNYRSRVFLATATACDEEMERRINNHRKERGGEFTTIEEPLDLARALGSLPETTELVVIDCLTVWLGNVFYSSNEAEPIVMKTINEFLGALGKIPFDSILITNEVGLGIVPDNKLARSFRDAAGYLNRKVAEIAHKVYLLCSGIPLDIKSLSRISS